MVQDATVYIAHIEWLAKILNQIDPEDAVNAMNLLCIGDDAMPRLKAELVIRLDAKHMNGFLAEDENWEVASVLEDIRLLNLQTTAWEAGDADEVRMRKDPLRFMMNYLIDEFEPGDFIKVIEAWLDITADKDTVLRLLTTLSDDHVAILIRDLSDSWKRRLVKALRTKNA
jgi:hypothetical protein